MRPHPIAVIKPSTDDGGMELLIPAVLVAILGVLAHAAGTDSRDADTRFRQLDW